LSYLSSLSLLLQHKTPGLQSGVFVSGLRFIIVGLTSCFIASSYAQDCAPTATLQPVSLHHVIDGDTVALVDGRHVRLIGINAPELGHQGRAGEPLGAIARSALAKLLAPTIYLQPGAEPRDHYGRMLAHVFQRQDGGSVEAQLLQQGLAQQVVIPPNVELVACLHRAEQTARAAGRGVWGEPYFAPRAAHALTAGDAGYRRVRLTITAAQSDRHGWWLETNGPLVLRLQHRNVEQFAGKPPTWIGRQWVVRGWVVNRKGDPFLESQGRAPLLMSLQNPGMVETGL